MSRPSNQLTIGDLFAACQPYPPDTYDRLTDEYKPYSPRVATSASAKPASLADDFDALMTFATT